MIYLDLPKPKRFGSFLITWFWQGVVAITWFSQKKKTGFALSQPVVISYRTRIYPVVTRIFAYVTGFENQGFPGKTRLFFTTFFFIGSWVSRYCTHASYHITNMQKKHRTRYAMISIARIYIYVYIHEHFRIKPLVGQGASDKAPHSREVDHYFGSLSGTDLFLIGLLRPFTGSHGFWPTIGISCKLSYPTLGFWDTDFQGPCRPQVWPLLVYVGVTFDRSSAMLYLFFHFCWANIKLMFGNLGLLKQICRDDLQQHASLRACSHETPSSQSDVLRPKKKSKKHGCFFSFLWKCLQLLLFVKHCPILSCKGHFEVIQCYTVIQDHTIQYFPAMAILSLFEFLSVLWHLPCLHYPLFSPNFSRPELSLPDISLFLDVCFLFRFMRKNFRGGFGAELGYSSPMGTEERKGSGREADERDAVWEEKKRRNISVERSNIFSK